MIFRHVVTLYSTTQNESPLGGLTFDPGNEGVAYQAFVQVRSESLDVINQTGSAATMATIYVLGSCPAKPLDRITYDGKTWEVTGAIPQRTPTAVHHTKIMARELDQTGR
jgi:hypothetical protein